MQIIFAGGSHYGLKGYESLQAYFSKIFLIKECGNDILQQKREQDEIVSDFNSVDCKYIFLCGYAKIITKEELNNKIFINVHGALLPKYRGMHSIFYAIMNGEKELGITYHLVNEWIDAGDIISQYSFPYYGQTVKEITDTIDDMVGEYSGLVCYKMCKGEITPVKQNEKEATFGAKRNLDDCLVDFYMSCEILQRFFKALTPSYPQPRIIIRNEVYTICGKYDIIKKDYYGPIGRVVNKNQLGVWIRIKDGFLIINDLINCYTGEQVNAEKILPIGYRFKSMIE